MVGHDEHKKEKRRMVFLENFPLLLGGRPKKGSLPLAAKARLAGLMETGLTTRMQNPSRQATLEVPVLLEGAAHLMCVAIAFMPPEQ